MTSTTQRLIFIALLSELLNSCATNPNPAPISTLPNVTLTSTHATIIKDETNHQNSTTYHLVKNGETLFAISKLFNLDYHKLAQWNQIAPPYKLEIGRKLSVTAPTLGNKATHVNEILLPKTKHEAVTEATPKTATANESTTLPPVISFNIFPVQPPYINNAPEKNGATSQKKSIVSNDNKSMLKLNFKWPIKGKVLNAYSKTDNKGIDIAGEIGQDISAAEAGKVVYSGQGLIGYGQLLIIKHNETYLSAYASDSQLLVEQGSSVEKGQIIAKMGLVGTNKTSLHFEIRKNGKPVNPINFLPEKF